MIEAAHRRQSDLCERLARIAGKLPRPCHFECRMAAALIALDPPHLSDEELWLFPVLRARCGQEAWIRAVLTRRDALPVPAARVVEVLAVLDALADEARAPLPEGPARQALTGFAAVQRRHLAWEARTVLSMAHEALDRADRQAVAERLLRNRGLPPEDDMRRIRAESCTLCTCKRPLRATGPWAALRLRAVPQHA